MGVEEKVLNVAVFCEYSFFFEDDVYKCFYGRNCDKKLSTQYESVCIHHTLQAQGILPINYVKQRV